MSSHDATHRARENLRVLSPTLAAAPGKASTYSAVVHGYIPPLGQRDAGGLYLSPLRRNEDAMLPAAAAAAAYDSPLRRELQPIAGGRSPACCPDGCIRS